MGKKRLATLAVAVLLGMAAGAQASPMLPTPFTFYTPGKTGVAFRHMTTFHMYFMAWRKGNGSWKPQNINFIKQYVQGQKAGVPLPPPPWYKVFKGGGTGGKHGGGPVEPPHKPPIPEPTSLALLGGGALFLVRRKREA